MSHVNAAAASDTSRTTLKPQRRMSSPNIYRGCSCNPFPLPNSDGRSARVGRLAGVVSKDAASERCGGLPPVRLEMLGRRHRLKHVRCVP